MVGFQTNLTFTEQKRIFKMVPGLENAVFERYGQMHRNTFIFSPDVLESSLQTKKRQDLFMAGQLTGVEGYAGNIATGLLAGMNCSRLFLGKNLITLPQTTMVGALCHYVSHASAKDFQPMKANLGLLLPHSEINRKTGKVQKGEFYARRAVKDLQEIMQKI